MIQSQKWRFVAAAAVFSGVFNTMFLPVVWYLDLTARQYCAASVVFSLGGLAFAAVMTHLDEAP